ncbi:hypothetical protein [Aeromonas simiae]
MAGLGVLGYVLRKLNVPLSPPILALYWRDAGATSAPGALHQ